MKEIWKDIEGFEGLYKISNFGRVKSLARKWESGTGFRKSHPDIILKEGIFENGYKTVTLYKNKKSKTKAIHRLVAQAFVLNLENKPQINHIDGNKKNNKGSNLEWSTAKENIQHSFKTGLQKVLFGEKHGSAKLKQIDVIKIKKLLKTNIAQCKIAKMFNVTPQHISKIKLNKRWTHITLTEI